MKNEMLLRRAWDAAFAAGEQMRTANGRLDWTDEEIDAAAAELRRRLLGDNNDDLSARCRSKARHYRRWWHFGMWHHECREFIALAEFAAFLSKQSRAKPEG